MVRAAPHNNVCATPRFRPSGRRVGLDLVAAERPEKEKHETGFLQNVRTVPLKKGPDLNPLSFIVDSSRTLD